MWLIIVFPTLLHHHHFLIIIPKELLLLSTAPRASAGSSFPTDASGGGVVLDGIKWTTCATSRPLLSRRMSLDGDLGDGGNGEDGMRTRAASSSSAASS
jgi:hypothetical protein